MRWLRQTSLIISKLIRESGTVVIVCHHAQGLIATEQDLHAERTISTIEMIHTVALSRIDAAIDHVFLVLTPVHVPWSSCIDPLPRLKMAGPS